MARKVVIVGAGPAGLAAALTLKGKADVTLIDSGKRVLERKCPSPDRCIQCGTCPKKYGIGGAGSFSDGKFIFETLLGNRAIGSNLYELIGIEQEQLYLKKAREIFQTFYGKEIQNPDLTKAKEIERVARSHDMDYLVALDQHIGTDKLPELIKSIESELENNGVEIITEEKIKDFNEKKIIGEKSNYTYDSLVLAPGRDGCLWLENLLRKKKIPYSFRPVDIGFRIETDEKILEHLVKTERDVKLQFRAPNGDSIRTFCVCPNGMVTAESCRGGYKLVNGMSSSYELSKNTNFALLTTIPLKKNVGTNSFGEALAILFREWGANQVTVQRLGDLNQDRSSKEHTLSEWRIKPTLRDVNIGDVGAMCYRHVRTLLYGIERLSVPGLMFGLNNYSTLLYGPELKSHGIKIQTTNQLRSTSGKYSDIYFAGDGSGFSRGIGGAMASGILAAEGITKEL